MDDALRNAEAGVAPGEQEPPQRRTAPSFMFLMFMLFLLTSHNGDEFLARHQYQHALDNLSEQLSNFTAWINGTESNFTLAARDADLNRLVHQFVPLDTRVDPLQAAYYTNVTGFSRGATRFHNLTVPFLENASGLPWDTPALAYMADANATTMESKLGSWNWTDNKLAFSANEKREADPVNPDMVRINGRVELTDEFADLELKFDFVGVHFLSNGSIFGLAEPSGYPIDIRLLPGIVPREYMNATARFVEPELLTRIQKLKDMIDAGVIEQDNMPSVESRLTTCPLSLFIQVDASSISAFEMELLEQEMEHPTGTPTVAPPKLSMSGVLISKECGFMLEVKHIEGLRSWAFFRKVTTYAGTASIVYFVLLFLLTRQMERSRTPAGIARVSRWLFFTQATVDSVSFAAHITFAIIADGRPSISLTAPAFLAGTMFIYEAQFAVLVHQVQMPEDNLVVVPPPTPIGATPPAVATPPRVVTPPPELAPPPVVRVTPPSPSSENGALPNAASEAAATPTAVPEAEATPALVTPPANVPRTPTFWAFAAQHLRRDPGARLWFMMFFFMTFIVRVILSPTLSLIFVALTYSGMWLPQIARSVRRGRASGFAKEYVVGMTAGRLSLMLYFLTCPNNVLDVEPRRWAYWLAAFVSFQAGVVMLQDTLGPAFFVPARFAKAKVYDYHPALPAPDPEAPEESLGDCAICMDAILVDSMARGSGRKSIDEKHGGGDGSVSGWGDAGKKGSGLLNAVQAGVTRKTYSLAPCHHLFHTECLEKWLAIKNICPQCRRPLPPL